MVVILCSDSRQLSTKFYFQSAFFFDAKKHVWHFCPVQPKTYFENRRIKFTPGFATNNALLFSVGKGSVAWTK